MKQLYQVPKTGKLLVNDVPAPQLTPGAILVRVFASLVSAGTERTAIEFAQKNLLEKARSRPDLLRQVMDKARREGLLTTFEAAMRKLDSPQSLGYSCAGEVIEVGEGVTAFNVGDRVACAGADYAVHAEMVAIPIHLACKIPSPDVSFADAAFTTLGAIAMHGLRLGEPQLGGSVAVIGLGLIGLLTVQLARAAGCTVLGMDPNAERCALAQGYGCSATATDKESFLSLVQRHTNGQGADCVLITAASPSNGPVELAAEVARSRAKVVSIGAVGTQLPRKPYFQKELQFLISRSYGPGRYDPNYEEKGQDYPIEFVRWTENRNMGAFLNLLAAGRLDVRSFITHEFSIEEAVGAYELISGKTGQPFLGVLIRYSGTCEPVRTLRLQARSTRSALGSSVSLGVMGAGNFAASVLLPAFGKTQQVAMRTLCTARGVSAKHVGSKFGFQSCTTSEADVLGDPEIDAVVLATRHASHARQIMAALRSGKHVFCEKPLCLNEDELHQIVALHDELNVAGQAPILMVGFNRRFSPMAQAARQFFSTISEPLLIQCRVNAGQIPLSSWIQDPAIGGGRIVGELCHFIDLCQFLAGSTCTRVYARALANNGRYADDNLSVTIDLANGSIATIAYVANGDKAMGKERIEVFGAGKSAALDDFRILELVTGGQRKKRHSWLRQDKGHQAECQAFLEAIRRGVSPIDLASIVNTTLTTFRILDSIRGNVPVDVDAPCTPHDRRL